MKQIMYIKTKVFIIVLIVFCFFHTPSSFGLPADDVIPLVDGDYYPQVHQALITASKSISCVMYMADINPKYNKGWEYNLVNDLIGAHRRGVDVSVIFDQNTMFWESGKNGKKNREKESGGIRTAQKEWRACELRQQRPCYSQKDISHRWLYYYFGEYKLDV